MLIGSFAFANTSDNTHDLNKIESVINVDNLITADILQFVDSQMTPIYCGFPFSFVTFTDGVGSFHYDCFDDHSENSNQLRFGLSMKYHYLLVLGN